MNNEFGLNYGFIDKLTDNVLIVSSDGKILFANKTATEIYGYTYDEMIQLNLINLIEHINNVEDVLTDEIVLNVIHNRKDGTKFIADIKLLNIDNSNKNRVISISKDANCMFDKLISNQSISKSFEIIDEAIIVFTKELNVYLWSKSAEEKFGYTFDEIRGKSVLNLIPEDRYDEFEHKIDILKQGGTIEGFQTKRIDKNGNPLDVLIAITPMYNCKGEFMGALGIYKDITEKLSLEHRLNETEERLKFAIEGGNLGVWDWNIITNVIYTSNLFNEMLGYEGNKISYTFNEMIDKIHIEDRDYIIDKINKLQVK